MKRLSEHLAEYVVKSGVVSKESYDVYQYSFQICFEMLGCQAVCLGIALYYHMIPEFLVSTAIFMLLRSYAGGVHLNSYFSCFVCSVGIQSSILFLNNICDCPMEIIWILILDSAILIMKAAPVECLNRELDDFEKVHCKRKTKRVMVAIIVFACICTLLKMQKIISLIAFTLLCILLSQYVGTVKYKVEKRNSI